MDKPPTEIKVLNLTGFPTQVIIHATKLPGKGTYLEKQDQIVKLNISNNDIGRTQMYLHNIMGAYSVSASTACHKIYKSSQVLNNLSAPDSKQIILLLDPKGIEPSPFPLTAGNHRLDELEGDVTFLRDEGLYTVNHTNNCDKKYFPRKGISTMRQALLAYLEAHNMDSQMETIVMPLHRPEAIQQGFIGGYKVDTSITGYEVPPSSLDPNQFNPEYYHNPVISNNVSGGGNINIRSGHDQRHFAKNGEGFPTAGMKNDYLKKYDFSETERVKAMKDGAMFLDHNQIQGFSGDAYADKPWYTRYWFYARDQTSQFSNWCWGAIILGVILLIVLAIGFIFIVVKKNGKSRSVDY